MRTIGFARLRAAMGDARGTELTRVLENKGAGDGGGRPSGLSGSRRLRAEMGSPPQPESGGPDGPGEIGRSDAGESSHKCGTFGEPDTKQPEAYRGITEKADYEEKRRYVPTGSGKKGMTRQEALLGQWLDTGYDDPVYEVVNGNTDALNKLFSNESVSGSTLMGTDSRFLNQLKDTEIGVYNSIHVTEGKDTADRFLRELESELNARQREEEEAYWAEEAERNPAGMSVFSTLTKPLSVFSYLKQAEKLAYHDSEAYRYAQEIQSKLNAGRAVTNIEMGQLTAAIYADALGVGEKQAAESGAQNEGKTSSGDSVQKTNPKSRRRFC